MPWMSENDGSRAASKIAPRGDLAQELLLLLFIALSPIQDFFLRNSFLRDAGGYPSLFPLLGILAISFLEWLKSGQFAVNKLGFWCCVYAFLVTMAGFFWFGTSSHAENLVWRTLTNLVSFGLFLGAIFVPRYAIYPRAVRAGCYGAFVILIMGFLLSHPTPFGIPALLENSIFHHTSLDDPRVRGLSSEPSYFSSATIAICLLCAHFCSTRLTKGCFVVGAVGLLALSGSKGGIVVLFICATVVLVLRFRRWYQIPALMVTLAPLALLGAAWLPTLIPEEGALQSGSIQDRAAMIVSAVEAIRHYPLGVGFSGFVPAVQAFIPDAMDLVQTHSPVPLPFAEPVQGLTDAHELSTHTVIFDQGVRFGVPFLVTFFFLSWKLLKQLISNGHKLLFVAALASFIAISTYVGMQYATAILFGIALAAPTSERSNEESLDRKLSSVPPA